VAGTDGLEFPVSVPPVRVIPLDVYVPELNVRFPLLLAIPPVNVIVYVPEVDVNVPELEIPPYNV
jgi:hypothetical protein